MPFLCGKRQHMHRISVRLKQPSKLCLLAVCACCVCASGVCARGVCLRLAVCACAVCPNAPHACVPACTLRLTQHTHTHTRARAYAYAEKHTPHSAPNHLFRTHPGGCPAARALCSYSNLQRHHQGLRTFLGERWLW